MGIENLTDIHVLIVGRDEFTDELVRKHNERYKNTAAYIPETEKGQEAQLNATKSAGLRATIFADPNLRSANISPIIPQDSEELLEAGKLPNPEEYWEDLGFSFKMLRGKEAKVNPKESSKLYDALKEGLKMGLFRNPFTNEVYPVDVLEGRILIANLGFVPADDMPLGGYFNVLQDLTQIYPHEIFQREGVIKFEGYGLKFGLPELKQLKDDGSRTVYLPQTGSTGSTGLMVLYRHCDSVLVARYGDLANSYWPGRGTFARRVEKNFDAELEIVKSSGLSGNELKKAVKLYQNATKLLGK